MKAAPRRSIICLTGAEWKTLQVASQHCLNTVFTRNINLQCQSNVVQFSRGPSLRNNSRYSKIISDSARQVCASHFYDKKQLLETKSGNLDNKPLETLYCQARARLKPSTIIIYFLLCRHLNKLYSTKLETGKNIIKHFKQVDRYIVHTTQV